jgi:hypothetical protein
MILTMSFCTILQPQSSCNHTIPIHANIECSLLQQLMVLLWGKGIPLNILATTTTHIIHISVYVTQHYGMNSILSLPMPNFTSLYNLVLLKVLSLMQTKHACHGVS